jgi:hypothetical protein
VWQENVFEAPDAIKGQRRGGGAYEGDDSKPCLNTNLLFCFIRSWRAISRASIPVFLKSQAPQLPSSFL